MTTPYGCRIDLCRVLGECDALSPAPGCPLFPDALQGTGSSFPQTDETVVGCSRDSERNVQNIAAGRVDVRVCASRHVGSIT